jgi:hypothetical protein
MLPGIPQPEREHPVEALKNLDTPLLVAVDDDFRVGVRAKIVAL